MAYSKCHHGGSFVGVILALAPLQGLYIEYRRLHVNAPKRVDGTHLTNNIHALISLFLIYQPIEIEAILLRDTTPPLPLSDNTPLFQPPSGALFLYDRSKVKAKQDNWLDGHEWISVGKKKDRKKTEGAIKGGHSKLSIDGLKRISQNTVRGHKFPSFVRQTYYLLNYTGCGKSDKSSEGPKSDGAKKKGREFKGLMLVHYLDTNVIEALPEVQQQNEVGDATTGDETGKNSDYQAGSTSKKVKCDIAQCVRVVVDGSLRCVKHQHLSKAKSRKGCKQKGFNTTTAEGVERYPKHAVKPSDNSETDHGEKVTVSVNKPTPDTKVGIGILQGKGFVKIHNIAPDGLFIGTDLTAGMVLESINGQNCTTCAEAVAMLRQTLGKMMIVAVEEKARLKAMQKKRKKKKKRCSHEGCVSQAQTGGVCFKHESKG